ncbi:MULTISPECIES: SAM-dependent methyltransferase [Cyanophyceae]|uniref:SAM-dependent methyltransferase n=1 Tax=Cyanophyceae TaxID=3028117 RepID=UPI00168A1628|nr:MULTISPECIES: SAM-dependent methyltransferase [Cyanophyceae]MBD1916308.1 SAM-dependent methyltransferase [Phormidium sp. FACHB-77]MBD2032600.1 SAM-dependent methyltransferase [Phormidium sp. FACHB-322]MBD2049972.1 SAM-dependent methyltransferase [Leptolyngbya sp. FACHB-60]
MSYYSVFPCDKSLEGLTYNLAEKYGYHYTRSLQKPVDTNHDPLPWFTYPAIEYLAQLDLSDKSVFEWGAGNSSLFFAKRCKRITSIESSKEWYGYCSQQSLPNQDIRFREESEFAEAIDESSSKFDLIIIDSLRRGECAQKSVKHLNDGGLIVLDNSDWHPNTSAFLRNDCNLIEVDMHGFGPVNDYSWTTSLYFHREFRFLSKEKKQPSFSKAGIQQVSKYDNFNSTLDQAQFGYS